MRRIVWLLMGSALWSAGCHRSGINSLTDVLSITCPANPNALTIDGQAATLDFGQVPIGERAGLEVDLSSLSGSSIGVTGIQTLQPNATLAFPLSAGTQIQAAPPTAVQATFVPTASGGQSAKWQIALSSGSTVELTLQGNGFPVDLSVNPDPVDFGSVELHTNFPQQVTVTNGSSQAVDLHILPPDAGPFVLQPPAPGPLGPGGQLTIAVTYTPLQVGNDLSSFTVTGCGNCSGGLVVPLQGTGVASILSFPNPFQLGFVQPRSSYTRILVLKNLGHQPIQILDPPVLYPGSFAPPPGQPPVFGFADGGSTPAYPVTLIANDELDLPITFTPPRLGAYLDATVTFQSTDPDLPTGTVDLEGYGGGAQISCQPASVDLGPVALGFTQSQSIVCLNVGTNVPGHPEAALQLSQTQLSVDNPRFAAALIGGPTVSLGAGQSAALQVSFAPLDAGPESATLQVGSNDVAHDPLAIPLTGRGVVPGKCAAAVLPAEGLSFGEVLPGSSATLQVGVQNQGDDYCIVQNVQLADGGDPAFSLPEGPLPYRLVSYVGDPYNTNGLPTELRIPVRYAPTQPESAARGTLQLRVANGTPMNYAVPLTGSSGSACLTFAPTQLDFGLVGLDPTTGDLCFQPRQTILVKNSCTSPVDITGLEINSELDATPQFALGGVPPLPTTLAAGDSFGFAVSFQATGPGATAELAQLQTDEFSTPYSISLTGDAEPGGQRTDSFVVQGKPVDILLVLDNDDDAQTGLVNFAPELLRLIGTADSELVDYQIAVTGTQSCLESDRGWFNPCPHCTAIGQNATYITPLSQPTGSAALGQLISSFWAAGTDGSPCYAYSGDEVFEFAYQAFDPALLAGHNAGFLRDNAFLEIIFFNSDGEEGNRLDLTAPQVAAFVQGLKPDPTMVSWTYVSTELTGQAQDVAQLTGGLTIDYTANGWQNQLLNLFSSTLGLGVFPLGARPNPSSLQVIVNGNSVPPTDAKGNSLWTYDPVRNAVAFAPGTVPHADSSVSISYSLSCS